MKSRVYGVLLGYKSGELLRKEDRMLIINELKATERGRKLLKYKIKSVEKQDEGFVLYFKEGYRYVDAEEWFYDQHRLGVRSALYLLIDPEDKPEGTQKHHKGVKFKDLVKGFLEEEGLRFENVEVEQEGFKYYLKDKKLGERWKKYHNERAKIVFVTPDQHNIIHMIQEQIDSYK